MGCSSWACSLSYRRCSTKFGTEAWSPNVRTYSILINACRRRVREREMVAKGFELDIATYTALIDGYFRNGERYKDPGEGYARPNVVVTSTCLICGLLLWKFLKEHITCLSEHTLHWWAQPLLWNEMFFFFPLSWAHKKNPQKCFLFLSRDPRYQNSSHLLSDLRLAWSSLLPRSLRLHTLPFVLTTLPLQPDKK